MSRVRGQGMVLPAVLLCVVAGCSSTAGPGPSGAAPQAGADRPVSSGRWTEAEVVITPTALGAVHLGMSMAEAQTAAGVVFDGSGDGAHYPTTLPPGPELYWTASCLGSSGVQPNAVRTVSTPEGVKIGDDVGHLTNTYGLRARYVPMPRGGRTPSEGYVIDYDSSTMAFKTADGKVVGITVGTKGQNDPSACGG